MPIHNTIRLRPMIPVIGVLLLLLSVVGLSADSPRASESSPSSLLLSDYSPAAAAAAADDAGEVLGSFVVRAPKWDVWAGGRRVLRRTRDELGALPLRDWLTDHVMYDESIDERGRQQAKNFVLNLARSAVDEGVLAATDELRRRHFIETVNVDVDAGLGGRFPHIGVDALGTLQESKFDATAWQLRGYAGEKGRNGGNAGLIYRRVLNDGWLLGFNAFVDVQTEDEGDFSRWSLGVESRSAWADLFANWYDGISDDIIRRRTAVTQEAIWTASGYDVELNVHAPSHRWLTGVLGWYSWGGGDDYGRADVEGVRIGIRVSPRELPVVWELTYDDDDENKDVGGRISYRHRFGASVGGGGAPSKFEPRDWFYTPVEREYTQRIFRATLTTTATTPTPTPPTPPLNLRGYRSFAINNVGSAEFSGRNAANEAGVVVVNNGDAAAMQTAVRDLFAGGGAVTLETADNAVVTVSYDTGVLRVGSTVVLDGLSVRLNRGSVSLQVNTGGFTVSAPESENVTVMVSVINRQPAVFRFTYVEEGDSSNTIALVRGNFDVITPDRTDNIKFSCAAGETPVATTIEGIDFGGVCVPAKIDQSESERLTLTVASDLTVGDGTRASPWEVPRTNLGAGGIVLADATGINGADYTFSGGNADFAVDADDGEIRFARDVSAVTVETRYTVTVTVAVTESSLTFTAEREVVFLAPVALPPITHELRFPSDLFTGGSGTQAAPYLYPLVLTVRNDNTRTTFTGTLVVDGGDGAAYTFNNLRASHLRALRTALPGQSAKERSLFLDAVSANSVLGTIKVDTTYHQIIQIESGPARNIARSVLTLWVRTVAPAPTPLSVRVEFDDAGAGSDTDPYVFGGASGAVGEVLATVRGVGGTPAHRFSKTGSGGPLEVDADNGEIRFETALATAKKVTITVQVTDSATPTAATATTVVVFDVDIALLPDVEFDGAGSGSDADPYVFGGTTGTTGAADTILATVSAGGGTPAASAPLYTYSKTGNGGALKVNTASGVIQIETALASSGKQTITVQVSDSATPPETASTVVVFDINVALQSELEFLVDAFNPDAPDTTPADGAGTEADPFVFEGTDTNLGLFLATVVSKGGTPRTGVGEQPYLREKVGTGGILNFDARGLIGVIPEQKPTGSGLHTITLKITDGAATPKEERLTVFISVYIESVTRTEPSLLYYSLAEFTAAGDALVLSEVSTKDGVVPIQGGFQACTRASLSQCGAGNLNNAAFSFSPGADDNIYRFARKPSADIADLNSYTSSFIVTLVGRVGFNIHDNNDVDLLSVTLEIVDAVVTPVAVTLTGAVVPAAPVRIGTYSQANAARPAGRNHITAHIDNSDVQRNNTTVLLYSGDIAANLESNVASVMISRIADPTPALRPLILPIPLQGCYRQFSKALIGGTSGVGAIAGAGTHMLFLHRDSIGGEDDVYLPFVGDSANLVFDGGYSAAAERLLVTLAGGDVISVVPNADGEAGASDAANFRRVYVDDGPANNRAVVLRIAVEEENPSCGTADRDGNNTFYLRNAADGKEWADLTGSSFSRLTFPAPVSDGTVAESAPIAIISDMAGNGTFTDPFVYAKSNNPMARFTFRDFTDRLTVSIVSEDFRATRTTDFVSRTDTDGPFGVDGSCGDNNQSCSISAPRSSTAAGAYRIVVAVGPMTIPPTSPTQNVTVYFSVAENPETRLATSGVPGRGTESDPFVFNEGEALLGETRTRSFRFLARVPHSYNVDGVAHQAPGATSFTAVTPAPFTQAFECRDNNADTPCSFVATAPLAAGAYRITARISDSETRRVSVHVLVRRATSGTARFLLSVSLLGTPLTNAGNQNDPYRTPGSGTALRGLRIEILGTGDLQSVGTVNPVVIEQIINTDFGRIPNFRLADSCRDAVAADTNCALVYDTSRSFTQGLYDIIILISHSDSTATRVRFYVNVVDDIVTVEGNVSEDVYATLPDPEGGNNAVVPLPFGGDGTVDDPYQLTDTTSRRARFVFTDSDAFQNTGGSTPFVIEKVQYRANDDAPFADEANGTDGRAVFIFDAFCQDTAATGTDCRIAQNGTGVPNLNVGGTYRIIATFTDTDAETRTRLTIHTTVSDAPRTPGAYMRGGEADPIDGTTTRLFNLRGDGSFGNPYRIPADTDNRARFEILNTENRMGGVVVEKVELLQAGAFVTRGEVGADANSRLEFVPVSDTCTDAISGVAEDDRTNCRLALNGFGRSIRQKNTTYRVTFLAPNNNGVMTRVQFHARIIDVKSPSSDAISGGNGTEGNPYIYKKSNRAPAVLMLGVRNFGANRFSMTYRQSTNDGASFGNEISTGSPFPFVTSSLPCNNSGRDCPIQARSNQIFANNTYRVRVRIEERSGGPFWYVFFFLKVTP